MKSIVIILAAIVGFSLPAYANVHVWNNKDFQAYSDKTEVRFMLINKYDQQADYYLRIDDKSFPNKLVLGPNQEIELNINVKTPAGKKTKKKICTRMVTDSPNSYEVCTNIKFKRY
ncbi:hypothetical protein L4C33_04095 [Vibrio makurazakiensis]|uniref:hypothetical protein n=1 Tax=Vibrio makurazakiensis TaxID=2910250 RepID=UPI003D0BBDC9